MSEDVVEAVNGLIVLVEKLSERISHLEKRMSEVELTTYAGVCTFTLSTNVTLNSGNFVFYCNKVNQEIPITEGVPLCPVDCPIKRIGQCPLEEIERDT